VTHGVVSLLAGLALAGQVLFVLLLLGIVVNLESVRTWFWGYELWTAFVIASIATGGSLFLSDVAGFIPCEMCWYQRICMYPLSLLTLFLAWHRDYRAARYLLPFPIIGAGVSIYHILIENKVVSKPTQCAVGAADCGTKWINYFGYMTIPTMALTAFALLTIFLGLAAAGAQEQAASLPADAER
jgi:disulfide bond formation protein DsbB